MEKVNGPDLKEGKQQSEGNVQQMSGNISLMSWRGFSWKNYGQTLHTYGHYIA